MESLITQVDSIILGFVQGSFGSLTATIQTLWRLMFVVFIAVYGYKVIISGRFSASDLIWHCLKIIILLVIATQWDTFFLFVYNMATDLPSDLAGLLIASAAGNAGTEASDETSANLALSEFFDRGMTVSSRILEGADWNDFGQYMYAGLVWFGTIGLTGYSTMLIVLSKLAVAILLSVGPIFILLLIFVNTKSLFEGWLRTLLNYAIVPIFVYALLALILMLIESPLTSLEENADTNGKLLSYIGPFLVTAIVSILLLSQILNMAASITGGVSLSTMGTGAWTARTGLKGTIGTGKWSWKVSKPARSYAATKIKSGMSNVRSAIQGAKEVK
jgi:type IV secretion system protein VirB6